MNRQHHYPLTVTWTGNQGQGTSYYRTYERSHTISIDRKADILGTSDTAFNGDKTKHSPEDLLVASIAACHMLWYLHLCSEAGVVVTAYTDHAVGTMQETKEGGGHFTEVRLHPNVVISDASMIDKAYALHQKAHALCYIANSCNFPIRHEPVCTTKDT